jgi:glyoxylase-like metal-dependent hydrolase (beta-lactamase superfamily II)
MRSEWRAALRHPSRGRIFAAMTPPLEAFTPLRDGDVLPLMGGLEVIHTPGHTPGSVCLYAARDRVLFTGDVLQHRFGRLSFASRLYSDDYRAARRTMRRLAELDVETIVFSHFPPLAERAAATLAELARRGAT